MEWPGRSCQHAKGGCRAPENREISAALNDPGVKKRLEDFNLDPHPGTPEQAAA
jgi:hypothetical protein